VAHFEDSFEECLQTLGEHGITLGVRDEGGARKEDVFNGFSRPSPKGSERREWIR
jgi:hypothetical protein